MVGTLYTVKQGFSFFFSWSEFFHFCGKKNQAHKTTQYVLVAETFFLNAAVKEKEAQATSGTFGVHPSHGSDIGSSPRMTPSMPLTLLGFYLECYYKLQVYNSPTHGKFKCITNKGVCEINIS